MVSFLIFVLVIFKLDSYFLFKQVWTQKCAVQKGKCGCQYFILLTLKNDEEKNPKLQFVHVHVYA
jgi:hypothetical protein